MKTKQDNNKLTKEQIENWRKIMFNLIGPYALIMPDAEVQQFKDRMQNKFNS